MNLALIGRAILKFLTKLLMSIASDAAIKFLFFYLAKQIVERTKTKKDDELYEFIKKNYDDYQARDKNQRLY